ncbi:polysaccharide biosynthesis/export family protein [uncultured Parvibaculum sp.]|uniref:polysaccharide biosynthesis/export family protein n=1 Tax=uncultured Parvibaculum sp. TaxID=291828 RepID=UPI0030D98963|tara:strand:+ start:30611 stop:32377 length:1767 start_codon:yes stop_codon:yes gene_type:complete
MRIWGAVFAVALLTVFGAGAIQAQGTTGGQGSDPTLRAPSSLPEPEPLGEIFGDPGGSEQPHAVQSSPVAGDLLLREQSGARTDIPNAVPPVPTGTLLPFGSQIFTNSSLVDRSVGVNPDYRIAQGDRIAVRMWGARTFDGVLVVDIQGNIFLPEIGPVRVEGVTNAQLAQRVRSSVASVFTDNVKVYTNLLGTQPLGVFVTGSVPYPGRYPGSKDDSVLYYLARAGGIDVDSGSFREIRVVRRGATVATIDLYRFLKDGVMPSVRFSDNDSIVVGQQMPTVAISGDVRNEYRYEYDPVRSTGAELIALAQPRPSASHALIRGVREGKQFNTYIPLSQMAAYKPTDGDTIAIEADREAETIVVKVDGNDMGPSAFAVPRATRLGAVAQLIEIDPTLADIESIYLRRQSVALRQQQAIDRALYELQRSVLTDSAISATEATMRVQEAALVERFVSQVRAVRPEGRVVLAGSNWREMILEDGDEIVIPKKSDVVVISGEVKLPQTVLWQDRRSIRAYIGDAGGVSNRGDAGRILVMRSDGSVHDGSKPIRKGDHIMVLPAANQKTFAVFRDIVEVVFRVALAAAVVIDAN